MKSVVIVSHVHYLLPCNEDPPARPPQPPAARPSDSTSAWRPSTFPGVFWQPTTLPYCNPATAAGPSSLPLLRLLPGHPPLPAAVRPTLHSSRVRSKLPEYRRCGSGQQLPVRHHANEVRSPPRHGHRRLALRTHSRFLELHDR